MSEGGFGGAAGADLEEQGSGERTGAQLFKGRGRARVPHRAGALSFEPRTPPPVLDRRYSRARERACASKASPPNSAGQAGAVRPWSRASTPLELAELRRATRATARRMTSYGAASFDDEDEDEYYAAALDQFEQKLPQKQQHMNNQQQ